MNTKWPPTVSQCPDYWDASGNTMCVNNTPAPKINFGTPAVSSNILDLTPYNGAGGKCLKYTWAVNNKISWDGVSNVKTPC